MLRSTNYERLNLCYQMTHFDILERFVGEEILRIIAPSGIHYIGASKEETLIIMSIIPASIRAKTITGLDLGIYKRGNYVLQVTTGEYISISHKLLLTKKLS